MHSSHRLHSVTARRSIRSAPLLVLGLFVMASLLAPAGAQMRTLQPGSLPLIGEAVQAAIIDSVVTVLDSSYVMAEEGARMVAHLRERWNEGAWRDVRDPVAFADTLDRAMHEVYDDGHLGLMVLPPADAGSEEEGPVRDLDAYRERMRRTNFGFEKLEILPGNVGYLRLNAFPGTEFAGDIAVAAMQFLANADAVILDLRGNGGGSAGMIQLLAGYLLSEQEHLIDWYIRATDTTKQSHSAAYVPGRRLPDTPLYILTSGRTFSAAEEFAFDMKNLERATLVGETTGGGGNTVASYMADFGDFRLVMRASWGAARDPRTGEGWEGTGVTPHMAVPAADALDAAHLAILESFMAEAGSAGAVDSDRKRALEWAWADVQSRLDPVELGPQALAAYAGTYGPRKIWVADGRLHYQREDRPASVLEPMAADLFRVVGLDFFRLRFERDEGGRITGLTGLYDNGHTDHHERG